MSPSFVPFRSPDEVVLTDGGTETMLAYKHDFPLRHEAAFEALESPKHYSIVEDFTAQYLSQAVSAGFSVTLNTSTYRASTNHFNLCDTPADKRDAYVTDRSVKLIRDAAKAEAGKSVGEARVFIIGMVGSLGDGYRGGAPTLDAARSYHRTQISALCKGNIDAIAAYTLTNSPEAAAIAIEASEEGLPCVIHFTLEGDGRTACGESLGSAILEVERLVEEAGAGRVAFFGVNCIHPNAMRLVLREGADKGETWVKRVKAFRGNASKLSHEVLEKTEEIDEGDPCEWGRAMCELREEFPSLQNIGGCCGTSPVHQAEIIKCLRCPK
jgi:homocysteine S-methyltransferase